MENASHLIATRRKEIEDGIAALLARIEELKRELPELEVAERVFARLASDGIPAPQAAQSPSPFQPFPHPSGKPTVPEMIYSVLQNAPGGLEPKVISKRIAEDALLPNVRPEAISSISWRMWKRGQLVKEGAVYKLPTAPQTNEGAV